MIRILQSFIDHHQCCISDSDVDESGEVHDWLQDLRVTRPSIIKVTISFIGKSTIITELMYIFIKNIVFFEFFIVFDD